jgi:hypothetical protein
LDLGVYNLTGKRKINRGEDRTILFGWKDGAGSLYDLTGYTGVFKASKGEGEDPFLNLTTVTFGTFTSGSNTFNIKLQISATASASVPKNAKGVYQFDITSPGSVVKRISEGQFEAGIKL